MERKQSILTGIIFIFTFILIIKSSLAAVLTNVGVRSADQTVSSVTTLTLFSTIVTAIDAGGRFQIVIPPTTSISSGVLACSMIEPSSITVSCQGNSVTRTITATLNNAMPGGTFFQVDINGFTNPDSTKTTDTFEFYTFGSLGTALDNRTSSTFLTATAGSLTSVSLVATDQTVAALNTINFNFTTTHSVTKGGTIQVTIPKWNPNASSASILSMVQGSFLWSALENLETTISWAFDTASDVLTVSNAFAGTDITAGTVIRFGVSGIRNPISTAAKSGFTISTISGDGGTVDSSSTTLTVTVSAAITLDKIASIGTKIVQESTTLELTFKSPVPLDTGWILQVIFPPSLPISTSILNNVRTVGLFGTARNFTGVTINTATRTVTITDGWSTYVTNTISAIVQFISIENPLSTSPTNSISITLTDINGFGIATLSSGIQYVATFGQMVSGTLSANPTVIGSNSAISVSLFPTHKITTQGVLKFTFPNDISFTSTTCTLSFRENIQAGASCIISGQEVRISDPFITDYLPSSSATSTIRFVINSARMPATTAPTGTFSFESVLVVSSIDYVIDKSSYINLVTATAGAITSATVTPSSTLANDLTTYTFSFVNTNEIVQDGKIQILLPSEIVFQNPATTANSCTTISGLGTSLIWEATSSSLTVNSGFSAGSLAGGSTVSFSITNVRSPSSLKPSSSFTIKTLSDNDFDIDNIDSGVIVTMITFNNITFIEVTPESLVNGATSNLDFKIVSPSPLKNGDILFITFPTQVQTPSLPITCTGTTALSGITCIRDSTGPDVIKVTLNFGVTTNVQASELLEFTISNWVNPTTIEPSDIFAFTVTDSLNFTINSWSGNIRVITTEAAQLLTPSLLPSSTIARADVNLIFTFSLAHNFPTTGVIYIYYPSTVGFNSTNLGCQCVDFTSGGSTTTCTWEQQTVSGRDRIIFRNAFASGLTASSIVRITLFGLINPTTADITNSFEIFTETSEVGGFEIDKATTGLTLQSDCDYPCLTWSTNSSACTSWIVTLEAFKLQSTTWVLDWSDDKFYNSTTNVCEDWAPQWGACTTIDKSVCTKWGLTGFEFLQLGTWTDTWPGRFFGNSTTNQWDAWDTASANCLNCNGTATNWTSCDSTSSHRYLNNNLWITACPANIFIQNDTLGQWISWDSNWGACSGTTTNWTSWNGNNKLDLRTNTWVATWETGLTIVTGSTWVAWDPSCDTWAGTITTWTSWAGGNVLTSLFTWAADCTNSNEIIISNTWTSWTPTWTSCQNTITNCTNWATDYALFQNEWISDWPLKYENKNQEWLFVGLVCPDSYTPDAIQESCIPLLKECKGGKVLNSDQTKCIPPGDIAPFPVLWLAVCLVIVVIAGKWKDKSKSKIIGNIIPLFGLVEIPAILLLSFTALFVGEFLIFGIALIAAIIGIFLNVIMSRFFRKYTMKDEDFQYFAKRYPKTADVLPFLWLIWSFRVLKFFYSGFFGLDTWMLTLSNAEGFFLKYFRRINYWYFFFVHIPVYLAWAIGIMSIEWGFQVLIECIEVPIVLLTIVLLTLLEKLYEKSHLKQDPYLPLNGMKKFRDDIAVMSAVPHPGMSRDKLLEEESKTDNYTASNEGDHNYMKEMEYDVELRKKALMSIINHVKNPERRNSLFDDDDRSIADCTFFEEEKYESNQRRKIHKPPRRAFSFKGLNPIDEEDEFLLSEQSSESDYRDMRFEQPPPKIERRMSFPMRADELENVENPIFHEAIDEFRNTLKQDLQDNCYADSKPPKPVVIIEPPVMAEMGTQTVLRDLLFDEEDSDEDLDRGEAEEVEVESDFAGNLIGEVIDQLSESSVFKEKKVLDADRLKEIPEFELEDILGEFDVDEGGNFIINSENGIDIDNNAKRVNPKGYLIDEDGNIITKKGEIIFYSYEINDDGEIPAPFVYEKHKNDFLAKALYKREGNDLEQDYLVDDDEDLVEEELKKLRPGSRESSVESLVADNPGMYVDDKVSRKELSAQVSPEGKLDAERVSKGRKSRISPQRKPMTYHDVELAHSYGGKPKGTLAPKKIKGQPKRIKREDTRELFPSLAVENQAKDKLSKIVDNISKKELDNSSDTTKLEKKQELKKRLQKLKDEHFRDLDSDELGDLNMDLIEQKIDDFDYNRQKEYDEKMKRHIESGGSAFGKPPLYTSSNFYQKRMPFLNSDLLPNSTNSRKALSKLNNHSILDARNKTKPISGLQKIYGNLGELVVPNEERDFNQKSRMHSPGSTSTLKSPFSKKMSRSKFESNSRIKGLEHIYMQKLEKQKKGTKGLSRKAKFRTLYNRYIDDQSIIEDEY